MLDEKARRATDGVLVVAKRYKNIIDIYSGPLQPLIKSKHSLSHTQKGDYQFNIDIRGNHLSIKEVQGLYLTKLGEAPYSVEEKCSDTKAKEIKSLLNKLTPEERDQLLRELSAE
jgi:hypothetical protein